MRWRVAGPEIHQILESRNLTYGNIAEPEPPTCIKYQIPNTKYTCNTGQSRNIHVAQSVSPRGAGRKQERTILRFTF